MKHDAVTCITLAALLSTQNLIEDPLLPREEKVSLFDQREQLLRGLLEYVQAAEPKQLDFATAPVRNFSDWSRSLSIRFFDGPPNVRDFCEWLIENPPPAGLPIASVDIYLCDFFQNVRNLGKVQ